MGDERRFPLLRDLRQRTDGSIQSVPWAMLTPHEEQAQRNHGQSLERLAERGGLGVCEMLFILDSKRLDFTKGSMTDTPEKVAELTRRVEAFEAASSTTKPSLNDSRDDRIAELEAERLTLARAFDAATRDLDCGDNSCRFKAHGAGGMRTNGGCSCLGVKDGGGMRGIEVSRAVEVSRRIVAEADAEVRRG